MCWYKFSGRTSLSIITGLILLLGLASCKNDSTSAKDTQQFFDIRGYFKADSARLSKLNPSVNKTVVHNGVSETKKVQIPNWGTELSLFTESDINKPAWKDSYHIQVANGFIIYDAREPSLKTRRVVIKKDGDKVKWVMIVNHTKNILYESFEKLSYFPDSLYVIQKKQTVRLLGTDLYKISGSFN